MHSPHDRATGRALQAKQREDNIATACRRACCDGRQLTVGKLCGEQKNGLIGQIYKTCENVLFKAYSSLYFHQQLLREVF